MHDLYRGALAPLCFCSDWLVDELIRCAKREGRVSVTVRTGYPGPGLNDLPPKGRESQMRWHQLFAELEPQGFRFYWSHVETIVLESDRIPSYFTIIVISWE